MKSSILQTVIENAFERRKELTPENTTPEVRNAVETAIALLDRGEARVAEKLDDHWQGIEWLKMAVLLYFRIQTNQVMENGAAHYYDKIPLKYLAHTQAEFLREGVRIVPPASVRYGAYLAPDVVLMPSYINIGAYVGDGTMVDTWATIGSCAQIGKHVHISGGVGIGGVLEPLQAGPVIIEDNCFIGARSEVVEGVVVREGTVLSMGVFIGASTKIVDRATGEVHVGKVPPYSVVVSGNLPGKPLPDGTPGPSLYCAVIVKKVDAQTRS